MRLSKTASLFKLKVCWSA